MDDLRVLIVADDPLARAGLAALLADQERCQVVGQVAHQADLLAEIDAAFPDVVLWDLGWEGGESLERLAELADDLPPVMVLLPGAARAEGDAATAWGAGARGLLLRNAGAGRVLAGLSALVHGLVVLDPELAAEMLLPDQGLETPMSLVEDLTAREMEVLQLLAEGLPNKAIARRLGISDHTVKFHVNAILGKLGAQSRTAAVVRATRAGLILL